jgi:hypothetical protein
MHIPERVVVEIFHVLLYVSKGFYDLATVPVISNAKFKVGKLSNYGMTYL